MKYYEVSYTLKKNNKRTDCTQVVQAVTGDRAVKYCKARLARETSSHPFTMRARVLKNHVQTGSEWSEDEELPDTAAEVPPEDVLLIALDMDGVVNSRKHWIAELDVEMSKVDASLPMLERKAKARSVLVDKYVDMTEYVVPELADKVRRICSETGAKILWSSSWRNLEQYSDIERAREMFTRRGLPGEALIGYTINLGADWAIYYARGEEIRTTLHGMKDVRVLRCAVLDDREDAGHLLPKNAKFFRIDPNVGIDDETADRVIAYLKGR